MPLFEIAIIELPTKKQAEDGQEEEIVFGPKAVIGKDAQSAAFKVAMDEKIECDRSRMQVLVRPFVPSSPKK